jgi:hypothetical protein
MSDWVSLSLREGNAKAQKEAERSSNQRGKADGDEKWVHGV